MSDRVHDFFDPDAFADMTVREIATSSLFDASEAERAEDLRSAQLDELDFGAGPQAASTGRASSTRASRRHALSALVAGLAVAGALFVHTLASNRVAPNARRPLVVTRHAPGAAGARGPVRAPDLRPPTAHRLGRAKPPAGRRPIAVDRTGADAVTPSGGASQVVRAPNASGEFGFER